MNFERVDDLIDFLEHRSERHNQNRWWRETELWDPIDVGNLHNRLRDTPGWSEENDKIMNAVVEPLPDWRCNTTACAAGWTAIRAGWQPRTPLDDEEMIYAPIEGYTDVDSIEPGAVSTASDIAMRILELTEDEAEEIFYEAETLQDIKSYVNEVRSNHEDEEDE